MRQYFAILFILIACKTLAYDIDVFLDEFDEEIDTFIPVDLK